MQYSIHSSKFSFKKFWGKDFRVEQLSCPAVYVHANGCQRDMPQQKMQNIMSGSWSFQDWLSDFLASISQQPCGRQMSQTSWCAGYCFGCRHKSIHSLFQLHLKEWERKWKVVPNNSKFSIGWRFDTEGVKFLDHYRRKIS